MALTLTASETGNEGETRVLATTMALAFTMALALAWKGGGRGRLRETGLEDEVRSIPIISGKALARRRPCVETRFRECRNATAQNFASAESRARRKNEEGGKSDSRVTYYEIRARVRLKDEKIPSVTRPASKGRPDGKTTSVARLKPVPRRACSRG